MGYQGRALGWLNLGGSHERGPGVFYDAGSPFHGDRQAVNVRIGLQPNANLNYSLSYDFVSFARESTNQKVFDLHVVNVRNTYQFTPRFLVRAIAQVDTSRRRILGDLLASYELVPGTVVHVGYGSLLERFHLDAYRPTARAFFFKASYLTRL